MQVVNTAYIRSRECAIQPDVIRASTNFAPSNQGPDRACPTGLDVGMTCIIYLVRPSFPCRPLWLPVPIMLMILCIFAPLKIYDVKGLQKYTRNRKQALKKRISSFYSLKAHLGVQHLVHPFLQPTPHPHHLLLHQSRNMLFDGRSTSIESRSTVALLNSVSVCRREYLLTDRDILPN